jgi:hypothetical protein
VSDMTFREWYDENLQRLVKGTLYDALQEAWQEADKQAKACVTELLDYAQHDSWRCGYHGECHCGLNAITDRYGLPAVPLPEKGEINEP